MSSNRGGVIGEDAVQTSKIQEFGCEKGDRYIHVKPVYLSQRMWTRY